MGFAIAGAAVVGGALASSSSNSAANKQAQAANRANAMQMQMFQQQRADAEPWRQAGMGALTQMQDPSFQQSFDGRNFQKDPGFQFRMDEGMKALQGSAAAKGNLNSGATLKALTRYGQNVASEEYGNAYNRFNTDQSNRFNRLSSLAGLGQTANTQVAAGGQNFANAYGQNQMGAANAQSAAAIAQGNAINGAIKTGGNAFMNYAEMDAYGRNRGVSNID